MLVHASGVLIIPLKHLVEVDLRPLRGPGELSPQNHLPKKPYTATVSWAHRCRPLLFRWYGFAHTQADLGFCWICLLGCCFDRGPETMHGGQWQNYRSNGIRGPKSLYRRWFSADGYILLSWTTCWGGGSEAWQGRYLCASQG